MAAAGSGERIKAQLDGPVHEPQRGGALSQADATSQRAAVIARDSRAMRIVDVPFSW